MGWRKMATLVAVVVLASACGGSDEDAEGATTSTSPGAGSGEVVTTFGNIPGVSDECTAVANLSVAVSQVLSGNLGDIPDDILDAIPADARADGQVILDAIRLFAESLDADGIELSQGGLADLTPEQLEAYVTATAEIFDADVEAAADRFGQYAVTCAPGG